MPAQASADSIQSVAEAIAAVEGDATLGDQDAFARRQRARDRLEVHAFGRLDAMGGAPELRRLAERAQRRLDEADERLFATLRAEIRAGGLRGAALLRRIDELVGRQAEHEPDNGGYDDLDAFVGGLLLATSEPLTPVGLEPEMVPYQPTPARIVLELAAKAGLGEGGVFFDLGSGLGHVPLLVHLLTGAPAVGIEMEPAYVELARARAADLRLPGVRFACADARAADLSGGTVFFLYTPFTGEVLREVLDRLEREARGRRIRLFTYGPCTPEVARQAWLRPVGAQPGDVHRLQDFRSG